MEEITFSKTIEFLSFYELNNMSKVTAFLHRESHMQVSYDYFSFHYTAT
jgi:hypothetical protein